MCKEFSPHGIQAHSINNSRSHSNAGFYSTGIALYINPDLPMQYSRLFSLLVLLSTLVIGATSCSDDSPTGGGSKEATGNLLPTSIGSSWAYTDQSGANTSEIIAEGDTVLNGATYTIFREDYCASRFIRREGDTWYEWQAAHPENPLPILKTGAKGKTWTHSYEEFYLFTIVTESTFEIVTVDTTLTLNGTTYDNVMAVRHIRADKSNGVKVTEEVVGTYYYSPDIGMVQFIPGKGSIQRDIRQLRAYIIK